MRGSYLHFISNTALHIIFLSYYICVLACLWLCLSENFLLNWLRQATTPWTTFWEDNRCHGWKLWMNKLSSELGLTVTCHTWSYVRWTENLPWNVVISSLMLFFDRYHLRETRFSGIEVIRNAGVIEQKRQNSAWVCWVCCEGIWDATSRTAFVEVRT